MAGNAQVNADAAAPAAPTGFVTNPPQTRYRRKRSAPPPGPVASLWWPVTSLVWSLSSGLRHHPATPRTAPLAAPLATPLATPLTTPLTTHHHHTPSPHPSSHSSPCRSVCATILHTPLLSGLRVLIKPASCCSLAGPLSNPNPLSALVTPTRDGNPNARW